MVCVSLRPQGGQWQPDMGKLELNTICAPAFVQRAKLTAMEHTGDVKPQLISHFKLCGDALVPLLQTLPGVQLALPKGGMCAFFRLQDQDRFGDSLAVAWRLVLEAGSGLVLGKAFVVLPSAKARGWLQWCFASQDIDCLVQGVGRLERWLGLYSKVLRNAALSRLTCRNTI